MISVKEIINKRRRGAEYREFIEKHCDIDAISRYKIIGGSCVEGFYEKLKDEVFVLKLTSKTDRENHGIIYVGNGGCPDLLNLAGKAIPPCVNPLKGIFEYSDEAGIRNPGSPHSNQMTPYNRELYVLATLCHLVLKLEHKPGLPVDDCLAEVVKQKSEDLPDFWAKSLNYTLARLSASVDVINERLMMLDKDAKTYSFPEMRKRLTERYGYLPEQIFV